MLIEELGKTIMARTGGRPHVAAHRLMPQTWLLRDPAILHVRLILEDVELLIEHYDNKKNNPWENGWASTGG